MRITSKGQVTVPHDIRVQFGFLPETEVEFEVVDGMVVLRKITSTNRAKNLLERMTGKATVGLSTDEIMRLTREE